MRPRWPTSRQSWRRRPAPSSSSSCPEAAPNHVGYFIKTAREGGYDHTTFHRAIKNGIIQGGDPLSKDASKKALYGTGGLGVLKAEINEQPMTAGAVAAVLQPGKPDSGGAQFFVAVTDQAAIQGQFTVFGRIVEGLEVVRTISESPVDANGKILDRVEITTVTIREAPPPEVEPFSTESVEELGKYRVVLETTLGHITLSFTPDKAPGHVRNFLRLASLGAYDGTRFHRIVRGLRGAGRHARHARGAASAEGAAVRAAPPARVQRSAAREGDAVDGAHRRPRQRVDVVFHLHRPCVRCSTASTRCSAT